MVLRKPEFDKYYLIRCISQGKLVTVKNQTHCSVIKREPKEAFRISSYPISFCKYIAKRLHLGRG